MRALGLILMALSTGPDSSGPVLHCDVIERNIVYTTDGDERLDQLVLWRFYPEVSEYHCCGWSFTHRCRRLPDIVFIQVNRNLPRVPVKYGRYFETHSYIDKEREDRIDWPNRENILSPTYVERPE